jgi:RNase P/RNase MRP subunit p30
LGSYTTRDGFLACSLTKQGFGKSFLNDGIFGCGIFSVVTHREEKNQVGDKVRNQFREQHDLFFTRSASFKVSPFSVEGTQIEALNLSFVDVYRAKTNYS